MDVTEPPVGALIDPTPADRPLSDYQPGELDLSSEEIRTIFLKTDERKRRARPPPSLLLEIPLEIPAGPVRRIMGRATDEGNMRSAKVARNLLRYFAEEYMLQVTKTAAVLARAEGRWTILDRHIEAAAKLYLMNRGQ